MSKRFDGWTNEDFTREYAAAIDRMMVPREKTYTTFGGQTLTVMVSGTKLDLPDEFSEAWGKLHGR